MEGWLSTATTPSSFYHNPKILAPYRGGHGAVLRQSRHNKDGPRDRPSADRANPLAIGARPSTDSQWLWFRHLSNRPSSQARRGAVRRKGVRGKSPDNERLAVLQAERASMTWEDWRPKWLAMRLLQRLKTLKTSKDIKIESMVLAIFLNN